MRCFYVFLLALTESGYQINANPKTFGATGRRTFYLDQNGIVHQNWGREPAAEHLDIPIVPTPPIDGAVEDH